MWFFRGSILLCRGRVMFLKLSWVVDEVAPAYVESVFLFEALSGGGGGG